MKASKFYTLIADEVTDVSNHEQLSIRLCYVPGAKVKEVFISYKSVERESLPDAILKWFGYSRTVTFRFEGAVL